MKHTKGIWYTTGKSYNDQPQISEERTGKTIALCYSLGEDQDGTTEAEANAHLIAAAPKLLKAVAQALEIFDGEWPIDDEIMGPVMKEYQALINEAEGA